MSHEGFPTVKRSLAERLGASRKRSIVGRTVLFLDTYQRLTPLDGWLREQFLPQLPQDCFGVFAGRNLRPEDSRNFLGRCGVPKPQPAAVLAFTHRHNHEDETLLPHKGGCSNVRRFRGIFGSATPMSNSRTGK